MSDQVPVDELAVEFTERLRRGERPSVDDYLRAHPALSGEIRELFPAIEAMERMKRRRFRESASTDGGLRRDGVLLERLGDYRIVRELGRGGMGIVYEAVQESLGRHVALKVLPRPAVMDERRRRRFEREARMAARLHHTNIVPVWGVGQEEGHHFIVMQFIRGVGLDEVLATLRSEPCDQPVGEASVGQQPPSRSEVAPGTEKGRSPWATTFAESLVRERLDELRRELRPAVASPGSGSGRIEADSRGPGESGKSTSPLADAVRADLSHSPGSQHPPSSLQLSAPALSHSLELTAAELQGRVSEEGAGESWSSSRVVERLSAATRRLSRTYWDNVARLGVQAAEALAYAHDLETLHRDIKPGNLMLDEQGNLWVVDFGLAKALAADPTQDNGGRSGASHSEDIVGTLRYMAPEQLQGKSDKRSDIYSLGLTLYELLTLRPAFDERDRRQLLEPTTRSEPPRPRRLEPRIPRDLETIVLKAIAPDPRHRYSRAEDLAADLQAFLEDRPIRARRVSPPERLWRWCRRNRSQAATSAAVLALLCAWASTASWGYWQTHRANLATSAALTRETREREKAEATLEISLQALERVYRWFVPDRMVDASMFSEDDRELLAPQDPPMSVESAALLEDILDSFDDLAEQNHDSERLAVASARANRRVGDIRRRLGDDGLAESAYREAITRYRRLDERFHRDHVIEIARCLNELGTLYRVRTYRQGDGEARQQARIAHEQAMLLLAPAGVTTERLSDITGMLPARRYELARTCYLLSRLEMFERRGATPPWLPTAITLLEHLRADSPDNHDYQLLLSQCLLTGDGVQRQRGLDLLEELVDAMPGSPDVRFELVVAYGGLDRFRPPPEDQLRRALENAQVLVTAHPNVREYRRAFFRIQQRLGAALTRQANVAPEPLRSLLLEEALALSEAAVDQAKRHADQAPNDVSLRFWLADAEDLMASQLLKMGRLDEARTVVERALERCSAAPSGPTHGLIAACYGTLAQVLRAQGDREGAAQFEAKAEHHQNEFRASFGPRGRR